jgi:toxin-antitoxin system PIN domain toxin
MIIPDANLLIYAYNSADKNHQQAAAWWEKQLNSKQPVGLSWVAISVFIRIMTHPKIFTTPMRAEEATVIVRSWLAQPNVIILQPGKQFAEHFLGLLENLGTAGNLTTDAYLAALTIEHQAELQSRDTDFARFPGLRWRNPLK